MADRFSVEDKGEYLLITLPRCQREGDYFACVDDVYDTAARLKKTKVLVDFTATPEPLPTMSVYSVAQHLLKRNMEYRIQMAIVFLHSAVLPDRFFQNVAQNRGARMRMFVEDFNAALSWLTG